MILIFFFIVYQSLLNILLSLYLHPIFEQIFFNLKFLQELSDYLNYYWTNQVGYRRYDFCSFYVIFFWFSISFCALRSLSFSWSFFTFFSYLAGGSLLFFYFLWELLLSRFLLGRDLLDQEIDRLIYLLYFS